MTSPKSKKGIYAVAISSIIIAVNLFVTTRFVSNTRKIIDLQSSSAIHLPVAPPQIDPEPTLPALEIAIRADGSAFIGEIPVTTDSLARLLHVNSPTKVIVHAEPGTKYTNLKSLLLALHDNGVTNVTVKTNEAK
jgi:biopolymer transport protein ExbD